MTTSLILNAVFAIGVLVIVVAPLLWAIATQHRDVPAATRTAVRTHAPTTRPATASSRRRPRPAVTRTA